jgi:hypothetical protein
MSLKLRQLITGAVTSLQLSNDDGASWENVPTVNSIDLIEEPVVKDEFTEPLPEEEQLANIAPVVTEEAAAARLEEE